MENNIETLEIQETEMVNEDLGFESFEEFEDKKPDNTALLVAGAIGAASLALGQVAWKKAIKPGLKWAKGKIKKALEDKEEKSEPEVIDAEVVEKK